MPLYEEKLINPLALRFTQEHIRTTFRDGRLVESTIEEIQGEEGQGDYDVILRAPFPHIEIIRWSPPSLKRSGDGDGEEAAAGAGTPGREHHWFTLDNRRLYCLQRAAVALLPKRVAVIVEILYADDGHIWRKYDTETEGWSVSISHSTRMAPICRWSWKDEVVPKGMSTVTELYKAHQATVAAQLDDRKTTVDDLQDTPSESIVERLSDALRRAEEHYEASASSRKAPVQADCPTPSTTDDSSEDEPEELAGAAASSAEATPRRLTAPSGGRRQSAAVGAEEAAQQSRSALAQLRKCLEAGKWMGRRGDAYELSFDGEASWTCVRKDNSGTKKFTVSYDEEYHIVWWGTEKAYYFDAAEVNEHSEQIGWYVASDWDKVKARFVWRAAEPRLAAAAGPSEEAAVARWETALAAEAVEEVKQQLREPMNKGRVWIAHWSSYYAPALGPLRGFLEGMPDEFAVTGLGGGKFTVRVVQGVSPQGQREEAAARAIQEVKGQLEAPTSDGSVHMPSWAKKYLQHLGSLREFLESRPEIFKVRSQGHRRFIVALAATSAEATRRR